ncbi:MAG: hypothetical protein IKF71_01830 [Bacilli bacterium]|nr:hypothetical protein [Bacilli bacterium]
MATKDKMVIYSKVQRFLEKHKDDYDRFEIQGVLDYAKESNIELIAKTDLIRGIYDELGYIPDDLNIYKIFTEIIDDQFGLNGKRICEVGGGVIPSLAKKIHLKQKKGNIMVYDPRLSQKERGGRRFLLKREFFHKHTPVEEVDLLIGLMPCEGSDPLIENALCHQKDFMIWLCEGGPHGDYFDFYESDDEWLNSTLSRVEYSVNKNQMGKLKVLNYPTFSDYPIIYNER